MSSTLHRRTPSNESMENQPLVTPIGGAPASPPTRSGGKKPGSASSGGSSPGGMKEIAIHHDVEDPKKSSTPGGGGGGGRNTKAPPLKAKTSNLNLENGGGGEGHQKDAAGPLSAASVKAITACFMYSFCSVSMILVNKSLASSYNHLIDGDLNILLVVFQAVVAVICVEFSKYMGWVDYPTLTYETAKSWAPVNLFFCGMLFTGMASLQNNSVPMVTVFKNITNVITTAGDYFFFGNQPEPMVIGAFGVMLFGAVAAAWNDISISFLGLFWMCMNCFCTAGYVLYMKFATQHIKLSKFGMVMVNNVLCVAFLLPAALIMGEVLVFLESDDIHTFGYYFKNFFAGFVGFFLNFASLNCVQTTGPTTYAIVGSLNKVPVAFLGYMLFDNVITFDTWCYIAVSMAGGFLYSYAKIETSRKGHNS